jgi:lysozyme
MGLHASRAALLAVVLLLADCRGEAANEETRSVTEAVEQCPAVSVEGVDVFDGQGRIDWVAVAAAGAQFAFIKATQGTYDTQATFAFNWSQAGRAGLLRSAYHFFDPTEDGAAQAAHFLSVVGSLSPGDLPPMVDIECPDGDPGCLYPGASGAASAADITTRMWAFLNAVEEATGQAPIVYTFTAFLAENGIQTSGLEAFPLALSDPSDTECIRAPDPWAQATFWQYSWNGSVQGIAGPVDRDRFLGTLDALKALEIPGSASVPASASVPPAASGGSPAAAHGCAVAGAPSASAQCSALPVLAVASILLARNRRRAVAPGAGRVLAVRSATP